MSKYPTEERNVICIVLLRKTLWRPELYSNRHTWGLLTVSSSKKNEYLSDKIFLRLHLISFPGLSCFLNYPHSNSYCFLFSAPIQLSTNFLGIKRKISECSCCFNIFWICQTLVARSDKKFVKITTVAMLLTALMGANPLFSCLAPILLVPRPGSSIYFVAIIVIGTFAGMKYTSLKIPAFRK